jgi:hypothetical protein
MHDARFNVEHDLLVAKLSFTLIADSINPGNAVKQLRPVKYFV